MKHDTPIDIDSLRGLSTMMFALRAPAMQLPGTKAVEVRPLPAAANDVHGEILASGADGVRAARATNACAPL